MIKRFTVLTLCVGFAFALVHAQGWNFIARINPALDEIAPFDAKVEKVAGDFGFLEGSVDPQGRVSPVQAIFPPTVIYKYNPADGKVSVAVPYSGFTGTDSSGVGMQMNNGQAMVILLGSNVR